MSDVQQAEKRLDAVRAESSAIESEELVGGKKIVAVLLFCVICVALNFIGSQIASLLPITVYFDNLGIILASCFGG